MATKCLLGLLAAAVLLSCAESSSGIVSLYTHFLENLRTQNVNLIAPGEYDSAYKNATLDLQLIDILELDEDEGCIEILVWLIEEFVDPRLTWDPEEFDNVKRLNLPRQLIWIPDWEVFNPRGAAKYFGEYKAIITHEGKVVRVPVLKIKARCDPRDANGRVHCGFKIGSWVYSDKVLSPTPSSESLNHEYYRSDAEWSLTTATATRRDTQYPCCEEIYPSIEYSITLEKKNKCKG